MITKREELFYKTLRSSFVGTRVKGSSGYINLMKIKSRYYSYIEKLIKEDIEKVISKYPDFRDELFDRLYSFFSNYLSENGNIYINPTTIHNQIYEKVYAEKDVSLFWKTRGLYYIKTERSFKSMEVELNGKIFYFDVSAIEYNKNNEKRDLLYKLEKIEENALYIKVYYKEGIKETDKENIIKEVNKHGFKMKEEDLEIAIKTFEKQSKIDYFIHKNARKFLKEQFDLWLYKYLIDTNTEWTPERIEQIQELKRIAYKLIDFIGQFEEELARIWEKPRFVRKSNYVISLDKIANKGGWEIIEKLPVLPGWKDQVKEWIDLRMIEEGPKSLLERKELKREYRFLPLDTRFFKEIELDILSLFHDLDEELDGWLIKSENWQALNTILPKFKGKIKMIYIDPPYNTGSDEFIYEDELRQSAWLTMLENRLRLAKEFLSKDGVIFVSIGDTTKNDKKTINSSLLNVLLSEVFGLENFVVTIVRKSGIAPRHDAKHIANSHDYVLCYAKDIQSLKLLRQPSELSEKSRYRYKDEFFNERGYFALNKLDRGSKKYSKTLDYAITIEEGQLIEIFDRGKFYKIKAPVSIELLPGGGRKDKRWIWTWSQDKVKWGIENGFVVFKEGKKGWQVYVKEYQFVDKDLKPIQRSVPYQSIIEDCFNEKGSAELHNFFGKDVKMQRTFYVNRDDVYVFYYRADLLSTEDKEKVIDYRKYPRNWYLILDEAHKGDKTDSKRQAIFTALSKEGFMFNFSATLQTL